MSMKILLELNAILATADDGDPGKPLNFSGKLIITLQIKYTLLLYTLFLIVWYQFGSLFMQFSPKCEGAFS